MKLVEWDAIEEKKTSPENLTGNKQNLIIPNVN